MSLNNTVLLNFIGLCDLFWFEICCFLCRIWLWWEMHLIFCCPRYRETDFFDIVLLSYFVIFTYIHPHHKVTRLLSSDIEIAQNTDTCWTHIKINTNTYWTDIKINTYFNILPLKKKHNYLLANFRIALETWNTSLFPSLACNLAFCMKIYLITCCSWHVV